MESQSFFASSPLSTADLLVEELKQVGALSTRETQSGVYFTGDLGVAYRACMWSRIANRIFLPLRTFRAETREALYEGAKAIEWDEHMSVDTTFAISSSTSQSQINHSQFAGLVVKDAIADYFQSKRGRRPSVDVRQPDIRINLHLKRDEASVSLDLSGESLHQRGYRRFSGKAALKENLAAAILLRAGWPEISAAGGGFWDPMCGIGTLPIEAAMIASDAAPGLLRKRFGFRKWRGHSPNLWQTIVAEARKRRMAGKRFIPEIVGTDEDYDSIEAAIRHVRNVGLESHVRFEVKSMDATPIEVKSSTGLLAVNPPYGHRLGSVPVLHSLYRNLGVMLTTHFQGWRMSVLTQDVNLAKSIPLRAHKIHTLYNGPLECKLLHFTITPDRIFKGKSRILAPESTVEFDPGYLTPGAVMVSNRIKKNLKELLAWSEKSDTHCYRLYDADMPGYSAAIDVYDHKWAHIQEYKAPATIDPEKARNRLKDLVQITMDLLNIRPENVFLKERRRQKEQYGKFDQKGQYYTVRENDRRFRVNFTDYLDTGLFLDHRIIRTWIGKQAQGKRFLNLYCYTGAATVMAVTGGAATSVSIDRSNTYLDWAKRNMQLNNARDPKHEFIRADCTEWLIDSKEMFDIIFLDPPTFSNTSSSPDILDVQRDHVKLIRLAMNRLEKNGVMIFSSNFRKFKLNAEELESYHSLDITKRTIPHDFKRRGNIYSCWLFGHKPVEFTLKSIA